MTRVEFPRRIKPLTITIPINHEKIFKESNKIN